MILDFSNQKGGWYIRTILSSVNWDISNQKGRWYITTSFSSINLDNFNQKGKYDSRITKGVWFLDFSNKRDTVSTQIERQRCIKILDIFAQAQP